MHPIKVSTDHFPISRFFWTDIIFSKCMVVRNSHPPWLIRTLHRPPSQTPGCQQLQRHEGRSVSYSSTYVFVYLQERSTIGHLENFTVAHVHVPVISTIYTHWQTSFNRSHLPTLRIISCKIRWTLLNHDVHRGIYRGNAKTTAQSRYMSTLTHKARKKRSVSIIRMTLWTGADRRAHITGS